MFIKRNRKLFYSYLSVLIVAGVLVCYSLLFHHIEDETLTKIIGLHIILEVLGASAAIFAGGFIFIRRGFKYDENLFVATALILMGIFDLIHSLCPPGESFVFWHCISSLSGSIFLASLLLVNKYKKHSVSLGIFLFDIAMLTIIVMHGVYQLNEPGFFINSSGGFTAYSQFLNFFGGILFIVSALHYSIQLYKKTNIENYIFLLVTALFAVSSITFQYSELWCPSWWLWHYERFAAFLAVYLTMFISYKNLVKELEHRMIEKESLLTNLNKKTSELSTTNRELEKFSFMISHNLQEPLRRIRSFCSLISKNINFTSDDKNYLERIDSSASLLSTQVENLNEYLLVQKRALKNEKIDICRLVDSVLSKYNLEINNGSITCENNITDTVKGDRYLLELLFKNLIENSIRFSSENRKVKFIRFNSSLYNGNVEFNIEDNGIGINKYALEKVFNPFYKGHSDKKLSTGTGMGLTFALNIVKKHNGNIIITSVEGKSTSIKIIIPNT